MSRLAFAPILVMTFVLAACEVADLPATDRDTTKSDTRDVSATETTDIGDGLTACDPFGEAANGGCPSEQFCEAVARVCVDCVGREQRCGEAGRETCEKPVATGLHTLTGGFWVADHCVGSEVCVPSGQLASCEPKVCDPNPSTWRCASPTTARQCNAYGSSEVLDVCGAGRACYEGKCDFIRHNVLLVFDTSGSMHNYLDYPNQNPDQCVVNGTPPCLAAFPACDDPNDPLTLFTLSKTIFADAIEASIGAYAQFALQRFPQHENATSTQKLCFFGWYAPSNRITDDDDSYAPAAGAWFDTHLGEAIVVPFPIRNTLDNTADILEWLDFKERLGATGGACTTSADCGTGQCGLDNGERRCFHHTDEELRAGGETPLGKSLFYAGEYIRRYVRVDGKACTIDANCGSSGYQCLDGKCKDPYRKCKDDFIVLFTDGVESEFKDETSFFNPVVQAKRLAFGLDCQSDDDCRGEAVCADSVCVVPGQPTAAMPRVPGDGHGALSSPDGQPISIRINVITLDGKDANNARIALFGGGESLDVSSSDPTTFRQRLQAKMSPNFKCRPEDL